MQSNLSYILLILLLCCSLTNIRSQDIKPEVLPIPLITNDSLAKTTFLPTTTIKKDTLEFNVKSFKTKADAEKALISRGYIVKSSLTKEVTILINESGLDSSKTKKARDSGVSIITNLNEIL